MNKDVLHNGKKELPAPIERNPIAKALRSLGWLIQTPGSEVGVRQLAQALDLTPSNAHKLLATLVSEGFVQQDSRTARYSLGGELLRWAYLIIARNPVPQIALEPMRRLVDRCGETAFLGIVDPVRQAMMFALSVESPHPLRYAVMLNTWMPLHTGASGLAILAFLPQEQISSIIERTGLAPATKASIIDRKQLDKVLGKIRHDGFAISHGQRIEGAVGIAAPVFGPSGEVIGDVAMTVPEARYAKFERDDLLQPLLRCTAEITAALSTPTSAKDSAGAADRGGTRVRKR